MIIAVDFDGTIVENKYPDIGDIIPGALCTLRRWKKAGHTIIINSCRAGLDEVKMEAWLIRNHVPHDFINRNDPERTKLYECECRKISADFYVDDHDMSRIDLTTGHIRPFTWITWLTYDYCLRLHEKTQQPTAQESTNVIIDDLDIVLGHNPLKSP